MMKKQPSAGGACPVSRRIARKGLGSLAENVITPRSSKRYRKACTHFFARRRRVGYALPSLAEEFDSVLCEYIEECWSEGDCRSHVANVLAGLQHFVAPLKRQLTGAWRLYAAWGRLELPCRAWPLSAFQTKALAGVAWSEGYHMMSILILLGFDAFFRTGELLAMKWGDFTFHPNQTVTITLPLSKGGQRKGIIEDVHVFDSNLVKLLEHFGKHQPKGALLLQAPEGWFRRMFADFCAMIRLPSTVKPYSLRRGGACHYFLLTGSMDKTMERGRWGNQKTARIYVNTALLEKNAAADATDKCLKKYSDIFSI